MIYISLPFSPILEGRQNIMKPTFSYAKLYGESKSGIIKAKFDPETQLFEKCVREPFRGPG